MEARGRRPVAFSVNVPDAMTTGGLATGVIHPRIDRREALQVPAVMRARNLICSLATLPVYVVDPSNRRTTRPFLVPNPDPEIPASVVMSQTVEDLLFESVSWWRITRFSATGWPIEARHIPHESVHVEGAVWPAQNRVSADNPTPIDGRVYIDGVHVEDAELIRFDSPNPPLLLHAARAIRTCLKLDRAAATYADHPMPLGYFTPKDGAADPADDNEIQEVLDDWETARQSRAWGYVNAALDAKTLSWNPEQLQLADQRQHAVLEIARAAGVDPEDLGVSTTSRTYSNREQRNQHLLDFTLGAYVSAIQERLSMRDVTPRGYQARIDFTGFLRTDVQTRMTAYQTGLAVGVYADEDEVREAEGRPPLTPAQKAKRAKPALPPAPPANEEGSEVTEQSNVLHVAFDADEPTHLTFDSPIVTETFRVNPEKRTVSGIAIPWNRVGNNGLSKWRFGKHSLHWSDVSRIKLNLHHNRQELVGRAVRLDSTDEGLDVTFKLADVPESHRALALAEDGVLDGFSIEAVFDTDAGDEWEFDPEDDMTRVVKRATLTGAALTGNPAFDDARVTRVAAASQTQKGETDMGESTSTTEAPAQQPAATPPALDLAAFTAGVSEALSAAVEAAIERLPLPQHDPEARQTVSAGRVQVTREEPVYSFSGRGPSVIRDAWHAKIDRNPDAQDRLNRFARQQEDIAASLSKRPDLAMAISTGNASEVIPPGYRPDMYVTQLLQGRPLFDGVSKGTLTDATPFVIPSFTSATGATADHVEGTNPTEGSMDLASVTVTPGGISGKFGLTREIVDSSNPAIDAIAFQAMRESYAQNAEAKIYAQLNGATGQGGTITAGFVPSGAQVSTTSGVAANTEFGGPQLLAGVRAALALYPFRRFAAPNRMHLSAEATSAFAAATGSDGRPLLPSIGAQNSAGIGNAVTQGWFVDGLAALPTWSMTGNAAGDADVLGYNSSDVWAWESPLLTFRFEEKNGPANIELALFGYFACRIIRPVGLFAIRHTAVGV